MFALSYMVEKAISTSRYARLRAPHAPAKAPYLRVTRSNASRCRYHLPCSNTNPSMFALIDPKHLHNMEWEDRLVPDKGNTATSGFQYFDTPFSVDSSVVEACSSLEIQGMATPRASYVLPLVSDQVKPGRWTGYRFKFHYLSSSSTSPSIETSSNNGAAERRPGSPDPSARR